MKIDDITARLAISVEAKFVVAMAAVLALTVGWLLSEREPTQKEMTFAYRKYMVAINTVRNPQGLGELRQRLHEIELIKQRCDKLDTKRYRCEAAVLIDDQPAAGPHAATNAIYRRDAKGWCFETIGEE